MSEVTRMSVYHFANKVMGCRPQQLYQMVNNGSFPKELYEDQLVGERIQPMVDVEKAKAWLEARRGPKVDHVVETIRILTEAGNTKLAASLQKWYDSQKTE